MDNDTAIRHTDAAGEELRAECHQLINTRDLMPSEIAARVGDLSSVLSTSAQIATYACNPPGVSRG